MIATTTKLAIPRPAAITRRLHELAQEQRMLRALLRVSLEASERGREEEDVGERRRTTSGPGRTA
jgi:hypothetical protein